MNIDEMLSSLEAIENDLRVRARASGQGAEGLTLSALASQALILRAALTGYQGEGPRALASLPAGVKS